MFYAFDVKQIAAPPTPVYSVPLTMPVSGDSWFTGEGYAGWAVNLYPNNYPGAAFVYDTPGNVQVSLDPGTLWGVLLFAECYVQGGECQAVVDPMFQFDQAAFDAQMGANTFNLADYYELEYSDNLAPEPSSAVLIGAGILGLGYARRRKLMVRHRDLGHAASWVACPTRCVRHGRCAAISMRIVLWPKVCSTSNARAARRFSRSTPRRAR